MLQDGHWQRYFIWHLVAFEEWPLLKLHINTNNTDIFKNLFDIILKVKVKICQRTFGSYHEIVA